MDSINANTPLNDVDNGVDTLRHDGAVPHANVRVFDIDRAILVCFVEMGRERHRRGRRLVMSL